MFESLLSKEKKEYNLVSHLFMASDETTIEDFIEQLYDNKKLHKWFNFLPFVWMTSDKAYFDPGCVTTFHIIFPPFSYKIICEEILPDNKGFSVVFSGLLTGKGKFEFIQKENGILLNHEMNLTGINWLIHLYYGIVCLGHDIYMCWRLSILKKILINQTVRKKQGELVK